MCFARLILFERHYFERVGSKHWSVVRDQRNKPKNYPTSSLSIPAFVKVAFNEYF
jgi:hypothetical protein